MTQLYKVILNLIFKTEYTILMYNKVKYVFYELFKTSKDKKKKAKTAKILVLKIKLTDWHSPRSVSQRICI